MASQTEYLKCRFCSWKTVKNYTSKRGQFKGVDKAFGRLSTHVRYTHPNEHKEIVADDAEWAETHPESQGFVP